MTSHGRIELAVRYYRKYPAPAPLGHTHAPVELEPRVTVFLIVDVYGLGYDDDDLAVSGVPSAHVGEARRNRTIVRDHIVPAKAAARSVGLPIVYLTNALSPSTNKRSQFRRLGLRSYGYDVLQEWQEGSPLLAFSNIIAPQSGDYLVRKQHYSGFFETDLDSLLRSLGAQTLVMVGFDSRICLGHTAVDAFCRNFDVIVLRDCTRTEEYAETAEGEWANLIAVRFLESNVGVTSTAAEWRRACEAAAADSGGVDDGLA